jgi:hypothetical protein
LARLNNFFTGAMNEEDRRRGGRGRGEEIEEEERGRS